MNYTAEERARQLGRLKGRIEAAQADYDLAFGRLTDHSVDKHLFQLALVEAARLSNELSVLTAALRQVNG